MGLDLEIQVEVSLQDMSCFRGQGKVVQASSRTGTVANLVICGHTCYTVFKIPVYTVETSHSITYS